jgi:hypothetical protein
MSLLEVKQIEELRNVSAEEIASRMLLAPMRSRDLFKKHYYLPKKGYKVISVPYFLWNPLITYQRQTAFLKHMLRGISY